MNHTLLFADIGGHEHDQYYHVGDEAMWYETYRWYRENKPDWKLTTCSWFAIHQSLDVHEVPHLHWPSLQSSLYFPKLLLKLAAWRLLGWELFSKRELEFVQTVIRHQRIHFTGGGNLSSQFRHWLYYCFFVIILARTYGLKVILTSQTIGPFRGVDRVFAFFILNLSDVITIRARTTTKNEFFKTGVFLPHLDWMVDAAYSLPVGGKVKSQKKSSELVLGLSLHCWEDFEDTVVSLIQEHLTALAKNHKLTLVLIPHHLTESNIGTDLLYMNRIVSGLPGSVRVVTPTSLELLCSDIPAQKIKELSSQVDLLLTTRYHGIIFALSQNVPVVALQLDKYYELKNRGALDIIYRNGVDKYQVSVNDTDVAEQLYNKTLRIIKNLDQEKKYLLNRNQQLLRSRHNLNTVMNQLEKTHRYV